MDSSQLKLYDPCGERKTRGEAVENPMAEASPKTGDKSASKSSLALQRVVGEARVAVSVGDLLPLLADAWGSKRAWLHDFSTDRVIVSQDLYEVLLAYKRTGIAKSA